VHSPFPASLTTRPSFNRVWRGGYYGGDPLHPTQCPEYGPLQLISSHYAIVKALIEPNVRPGSRVLEIGPGRGAWTRCFREASEVYCVDALSAEHNGFWEFVGRDPRIRYLQVRDETLRACPDGHFDFIFSFGAFCHMPQAVREGYLRSMFAKARSGATCVVMYADYDKLNAAWSDLSGKRTVSLSWTGAKALARFYAGRLLSRVRASEGLLDKLDASERPGRFYHGGIAETGAFLEAVGWRVITPDIGLNLRDPIAVFQKP
jgi:phospholipid N-methyltransferase